MPEAAAVAVHLQDVDVVGETVQQRAGEAFRSEHLGPLIEGQVGSDQDGAALAALAEDLEEQFRPGAGQGGTKPSSSIISRLSRDSCRWRFKQASLVPGLHQLVDEGGGGESHGQSPPAGGQAQPQGHMGLASAAVADSYDVFTAIDVFAAGQFPPGPCSPRVWPGSRRCPGS